MIKWYLQVELIGEKQAGELQCVIGLDITVGWHLAGALGVFGRL